MQTKQLQRESQVRLSGFIDDLRSSGGVDLSAKNLGEEGTQYISEGLAFNDRCAAHSKLTEDGFTQWIRVCKYRLIYHPPASEDLLNLKWIGALPVAYLAEQIQPRAAGHGLGCET